MSQQKAILIPVYIDDVDVLIQALEFSKCMHKSMLDDFFVKGTSCGEIDPDRISDIIDVCGRMVEKIQKYKRKYDLGEGC